MYKRQVKGARFGIAVARFNSFIVESLLEGALDTLKRHGAEESDIEIVRVPGAYELPLAIKKMASANKYDGIIALGFPAASLAKPGPHPLPV